MSTFQTESPLRLVGPIPIQIAGYHARRGRENALWFRLQYGRNICKSSGGPIDNWRHCTHLAESRFQPDPAVSPKLTFKTAWIALAAALVCCVAPMDSRAAVDRASLTNFDVRASAPRKSAQASQKAAHEKLKQAVPSAAVDFDPLLNTPKWVHSSGGFLTGENGEGKSVSAETAKKFDRDPDKALKGFLHEQRDLFRHGPEVLSDAKKTREHETTVLRTVAWEQQVDGIPVMDSILVAHTTARGELISISSLFVPEPAAAAEKGTPNHTAKVRKPGVSAEQALRIAVENLGEVIEEVGPSHMRVERHRIELRGHKDLANARIDTITQGDIDDTILSGQRDGRV